MSVLYTCIRYRAELLVSVQRQDKETEVTKKEEMKNSKLSPSCLQTTGFSTRQTLKTPLENSEL